jgi:hypothetical protein
MTLSRKDVLDAKALAERVCRVGDPLWRQQEAAGDHIAASRTSVPALADALLEAVALLRECATLPSEFEDDRMSYVVVQMDKSLRDALRTLLAAFDAEGS